MYSHLKLVRRSVFNRLISLLICLLLLSLNIYGCGGSSGSGSDDDDISPDGSNSVDDVTAEISISPIGGEYALSNGIVLRIPEGAVNQETKFTFTLVDKDVVMPTLNSYGITDKYFMAAFEVEPYNFKFEKPIDIILPVEIPLDSTDLPYLFRVNVEKNIYSLARLNSYASLSTAHSIIQEIPWQKYLKFDCDKNTVELINYDEFKRESYYVMCQINAIIDHSGCIEDPCRCCRFEVVEEASDHVVDDECFNLTVKGSINFFDCENDPIQNWNMEEKSIGSIEFVPENLKIKVGESVSVSAIVKDAEGNILNDYSIKKVESNNPLKAEVITWGSDYFIIKGVLVGETTVIADFGCGIKDQISVIVEETSLVISPSEITVPEGELRAFSLRLSDPPPVSSSVNVTVSHFSGDSDIYVHDGMSLTFTHENWDQEQSVTLGAAEDNDIDNDTATFRIDADKNYIWTAMITATESDNDILKFVPNHYTVTIPENVTRALYVKLNNDPITTVNATVTHDSGDNNIKVISGSSLTFDSTNWDDEYEHQFSLHADDDPDMENGTATIRISSTNVEDLIITVTEIDDDGFRTRPSAVTVPEGSTAIFEVKLSGDPMKTITVNVNRVSGDGDIDVISGSLLTFGSTDWDDYQPVTLFAAEDDDEVNGETRIKISSPDVGNNLYKIVEESDNDYIDMSGNWEEEVTSGGQTCLISEGGLEGEDWTFEEEWSNVILPIVVTQVDRDLAVQNTDYPTSEPHVGTLSNTSDPEYPYKFSFSVSSSNTIDCIRFFQSNGTDFKFGEGVCGDNIVCEPISCFETEIVGGKVSADGNSFIGTSLHTFTATADARELLDGKWHYYPNSQITCEGGSYIQATRK